MCSGDGEDEYGAFAFAAGLANGEKHPRSANVRASSVDADNNEKHPAATCGFLRRAVARGRMLLFVAHCHDTVAIVIFAIDGPGLRILAVTVTAEPA